MSTKATIFLTEDNEHCFTDCSEPVKNNEGNYIGDQITIEFDAKNAYLEGVEEDGFCVVLKNPKSDIYKRILSLNKDQQLFTKEDMIEFADFVDYCNEDMFEDWLKNYRGK